MPARHRTMLAGIVVIAAVARFATLGVQSYWFDEATTVHLLRLDLRGLLSAIPDSESTPPLYYVVAWFWAKLFGTGEVGLRSLSALCGTLTIPVVYAIGARAVNARVGLIAAALAATNPLLVWYSQEARAYALLVLLCALTLVVLPHALERPTAGRLTTWAALAALAVTTHYFAAFLVVPEAIWLLHRWRARALAPVAAVGAVALALLPITLEQASNDGAKFIRGQSLAERLVAVPKQLVAGYDAPGEVPATALAALLVLFGLYLLVRRTTPEERRAARPLAVLALAVVAIPTLLALVNADYLVTRNVIAALVPALVVLATGYGAARAGRGGVAAAALLCAVGLALVVGVALDKRHQRDDWRGVAEALGPATRPRMLIVNPVNGRIPLEVYLKGAHKPRRDSADPLQEIDVIGLNGHGPGESANRPRSPTPAAPPGYTVARRVDDPGYTLITYRAAEPHQFVDATYYSMSLGNGLADLVLQPAER
jgi:hypothetical protein